MNPIPVKDGLFEAAHSQVVYEEKRLAQYQDRKHKAVMNAYLNKHEIDLSDPQEPYYPNSEEWWVQQDKDTQFIEDNS